jgi:D-alanine-D-alanine ligase
MKAVIVYDRIVEEGGSPDQRDVLEQAKAAREALTDLGFESVTLPFSFDLQSFTESIRDLQPDLVFNLVESVEGHGRLLYLASAMLDSHPDLQPTSHDQQACQEDPYPIRDKTPKFFGR